MGQNSLLVHQRVTPSWGNAPLCLLPQPLKCQQWKGKNKKRKPFLHRPHWCGKKLGFWHWYGGYPPPPRPSDSFFTLWLNPLGNCGFILQQAQSFLFGSGKFSFIRGLLLVLFVCF